METEKIISYFKEISSIPRQSGDEKAVSDYLTAFAKELGLWVKQDKDYNVLVKKPATKGMEKRDTIILQGHMDMVYVVAQGMEHCYQNGIEVIDDGVFLHANGTTLGADNGIALAYAMMLMAEKDIPLPSLEFIFTSKEEIGLLGGASADISELEGKMIINLDSEEEGMFCSGCAGGIGACIKLPIEKEKAEIPLVPLHISIGGLKGGHSGMEIQLERGNAIQLIGRVLQRLEKYDARIGETESIGKFNAIANTGEILCYVKEEALSKVKEEIAELERELKNELSPADDVQFIVREEEIVSDCEVFTKKTAETLKNFLVLMLQGVMNMSAAVEGLVQTSINTGGMEEKEGCLLFHSALRSSVETQKQFLISRIQTIVDVLGMECEWSGEYPGWQYRENSKLREIATEKYRELFGKEPKIEAVHAGLECGYWAEKIKDADILSIGPDMIDVHTPNEKVSKQSIENVWELLKAILS